MVRRLIFLVIMLCSLQAKADDIESIKAIVDGNLITSADIKNRANFLIKTNNLNASVELLERQVLQNLIDEQLFINEAKKLDISVDESEMLYSLNMIAQQNNMSLIEFRRSLEDTGVSFSELEKQLKPRLLWNQIMHLYIEPKIYVTDSEIENNYAVLFNNLLSETVMYKLAEITIFTSEHANEQTTAALLNELVQKIQEGKEFSVLAKQFSQSSTAEKGGDIGWVYKNNLSPQILEKVVHLQAGEVSTPVIMPNMVQILKLIDKKNKKISKDMVLNSDASINIVRRKKLDSQIKNYLHRLRRTAFIEIK